MIVDGVPAGATGRFPVVIAGAGPAGLVLALELSRHGIQALVLAGGDDGYTERFQTLADAEIVDAAHHAPMSQAVRRALGGTSLLWGGRCVPFDEIDFVSRPYAGCFGWPIGAGDVAPWYDTAVRYLSAGGSIFSKPLPQMAFSPDIQFDRIERWSEGRNLRHSQAGALESETGPCIALGAVAVGIEIDPASGRVNSLSVANRDGTIARLRARAFVLACGGLETTRLMLLPRMQQPSLFGGPDGALGRYYMGHIEGRIAEICFASPVPDAEFDFMVDGSRHYFRRRIMLTAAAQLEHKLLNLAAWPDNPLLGDPRHASAILSLACIALRTPGLRDFLAAEAIRQKHLRNSPPETGRHLKNILGGLPEAVREATKFLYGRYVARPRLPGFFLLNKTRRYTFLYHAEQSPNPVSIVSLADSRDSLGVPRLRIDWRFNEIDGRSVLRSHELIDTALRETGFGRLDYAYPKEELMDQVFAQITDGYHQIGTTRMSDDPARGIVDCDCRVHGTPNLFISSSSTFPTSGQANPTLLITALSARLAAHLAAGLRNLDEPVEQS